MQKSAICCLLLLCLSAGRAAANGDAYGNEVGTIFFTGGGKCFAGEFCALEAVWYVIEGRGRDVFKLAGKERVTIYFVNLRSDGYDFNMDKISFVVDRQNVTGRRTSADNVVVLDATGQREIGRGKCHVRAENDDHTVESCDLDFSEGERRVALNYNIEVKERRTEVDITAKLDVAARSIFYSADNLQFDLVSSAMCMRVPWCNSSTRWWHFPFTDRDALGWVQSQLGIEITKDDEPDPEGH